MLDNVSQQRRNNHATFYTYAVVATTPPAAGTTSPDRMWASVNPTTVLGPVMAKFMKSMRS